MLIARAGSDQEKTFGPTISGLIHRHIEPERLLLWDSKVRGGRPDTMKILKEVYHSWQAESTCTVPTLDSPADASASCVHHLELHRQL